MKRLIPIILAASIAATPYTVESQSNQPRLVQVVRCVSVIILTVVGGVVIYIVVKKCDRFFSNQNWQLTNDEPSMTLYSGNTNNVPTVLQSSLGLGQAWVDEYSFSLSQTEKGIVAVAFKDGAPVLTNTCPAPVDGSTPILDFRSLPMTNQTPNRVFRLLN